MEAECCTLRHTVEAIGDGSIGVSLSHGLEDLCIIRNRNQPNIQPESIRQLGKGLLLHRALENHDRPILQVQDRRDPGILSRIDLKPVGQHRIFVKPEFLCAFRRSSHVRHQVDLTHQ